jgi:hypothetical protein
MPAVIVLQDAKEGSSSSSSQFENSEKAIMSSRHAEIEGDYTRTIHRLCTGKVMSNNVKPSVI